MQEFNGKARFVSENYGDSKLAKRFGVTRYPAIFVNDVLVATPNDFGFYGKGAGKEGGRYAPLKSAESHQKFRSDLKNMIDLLLAGRTADARAKAAHADSAEIATLPALNVLDLNGKVVNSRDFAGRVVLVEFWATWCPPCRSTLQWLGNVKKQYGDRIVVAAISVESEEAAVLKLTKELDLPITWVAGSPALARKFGDIAAVPTLFVFDREGKTAAVYYGAPPTLHANAEATVASLLKTPRSSAAARSPSR